MASVTIERTMQRSSTILAVCGRRSEIHAPLAPCCVKPNCGAGERQRRLVAGHAGQPLSLPHRVGQLLAVAPVEQRLVVERFHLRRAAGHEQIDDALGLRGHVQRTSEHAAIWNGLAGLGLRQRRRAAADPRGPAHRGPCRRGSAACAATALPPAPIRCSRPPSRAAARRDSSQHHVLVEVDDRVDHGGCCRQGCQGRRFGGRQRWIRRRRADVDVLQRVGGVPRVPPVLLFEQCAQNTGFDSVRLTADERAERVAMAIAWLPGVPL